MSILWKLVKFTLEDNMGQWVVPYCTKYNKDQAVSSLDQTLLDHVEKYNIVWAICAFDSWEIKHDVNH